MTERFEIAVVGAGPVGLLGALAAARGGRRTCLVGPLPEGRDGRTAALLAPSVALLEALDLWPFLVADAAPLRRLRIVDDSGSLFRPPPVEFKPEEVGLDAFGWNIENARLASVLAEAVRTDARISWRPDLAEGFAPGERARVILAGGGAVEADLAVAADGRRSRIREAAAIVVRETRYRQVAVTAILRHASPHRGVSTEFHKRGGPLTLVPMPERGGEARSSLVWVTSPPHARRLAGLDDDAFARAVAFACHDLLSEMWVDGARGSVPLAAMTAHRFAGDRLALAGEAAHVLPPIGAQGLNLGFSDIASLRNLWSESDDPGSPALLARYDRARRPDAALRSLAVDGLNRALLSHSPFLDAMRGVGLGLLARIGPLRRAVMGAGLPQALTAPAGTRPARSARSRPAA